MHFRTLALAVVISSSLLLAPTVLDVNYLGRSASIILTGGSGE